VNVRFETGFTDGLSRVRDASGRERPERHANQMPLGRNRLPGPTEQSEVGAGKRRGGPKTASMTQDCKRLTSSQSLQRHVIRAQTCADCNRGNQIQAVRQWIR
jgi:hypothetical protein